jgi:hypothetical protein
MKMSIFLSKQFQYNWQQNYHIGCLKIFLFLNIVLISYLFFNLEKHWVWTGRYPIHMIWHTLIWQWPAIVSHTLPISWFISTLWVNLQHRTILKDVWLCGYTWHHHIRYQAYGTLFWLVIMIGLVWWIIPWCAAQDHVTHLLPWLLTTAPKNTIYHLSKTMWYGALQNGYFLAWHSSQQHVGIFFKTMTVYHHQLHLQHGVLLDGRGWFSYFQSLYLNFKMPITGQDKLLFTQATYGYRLWSSTTILGFSGISWIISDWRSKCSSYLCAMMAVISIITVWYDQSFWVWPFLGLLCHFLIYFHAHPFSR